MIVNEWNQNSILKSMVQSTVLCHTEIMQDHGAGVRMDNGGSAYTGTSTAQQRTRGSLNTDNGRHTNTGISTSAVWLTAENSAIITI